MVDSFAKLGNCILLVMLTCALDSVKCLIIDENKFVNAWYCLVCSQSRYECTHAHNHNCSSAR